MTLCLIATLIKITLKEIQGLDQTLISSSPNRTALGGWEKPAQSIRQSNLMQGVSPTLLSSVIDTYMHDDGHLALEVHTEPYVDQNI